MEYVPIGELTVLYWYLSPDHDIALQLQDVLIGEDGTKAQDTHASFL